MPSSDVGTGASITFGTSGFSAQLLSISGNGIERAAIDTTHLGTTTARTHMPGDLYDPGELEIEFAFDPDDTPPYDQAAETITVTFPIPAGLSSGATDACTGFMTNFSWGVPLEDKMTGSATIKYSGAHTWTDSA